MEEQTAAKLAESLTKLQSSTGGGLVGMMEFTWSSIAASLLFGAVGMWMFGVARRRGRFSLLAIALALMIYPYFTQGPSQDWGLGTGLCGIAYFIWEDA